MSKRIVADDSVIRAHGASVRKPVRRIARRKDKLDKHGMRVPVLVKGIENARKVRKGTETVDTSTSKGTAYTMQNPPPFRGSFRGQTVYVRNRRKAGERAAIDHRKAGPGNVDWYVTDADGNIARYENGEPIPGKYHLYRTEHDSVWTWNGTRWVRDHRTNVG